MNRPQVVSSAAGPLVVSEANPRYFTIRSDNTSDRRVIYLTGSHINNNFHDGMGPGSDCPETPEKFDYSAYLKFLKDHGVGSTGGCNTVGFGCCPDRRCRSGEAGSSGRVVGSG